MAKLKNALAGLFVLILGGYLAYTGAQEFNNSRKLRARGKVTVGEVTDSSTSYGRRTKYYLTVSFKTEAGQNVSERVQVGVSEYLATLSNPRIKMHYLAENPSVCAAGESVSLKFWYLLLGVFMSAAGGFLLVFYKVPTDTKSTAEYVNKEFEKLCISKHEYAPADLRQFKHLDLAWLDAGRQKLESMGYAFQQDTENLTVSRNTPSFRTFLRLLLGRNGTVMAALFHIKPPWYYRMLGAKHARVIDVETEFVNGQWLITNTAASVASPDLPPQLDSFSLPANTPIELVLQAHDQRVGKYMVAHPGVQAVRMTSVEDLLRGQNRQEELKVAFRRERGVSKAELERIAGKFSTDLDEVHAETKRQHEERQRAA